jgi:hypothetical protein
MTEVSKSEPLLVREPVVEADCFDGDMNLDLSSRFEAGCVVEGGIADDIATEDHAGRSRKLHESSTTIKS